MLAVFAQLELATITERVRFGYAQRISLGKWSGQPPYGYRYGSSGVLEADPETAPWLKAIYREVRDRSLPDLAGWLASQGAPTYRGGEWTISTLANGLHNRAYLGERRTRDGWIRSGHAPLVT
ncbi:Recombinase, partial [mine drainage metagenome]